MKTLADIYKVRARFQRSTRIDDDSGDASALEGFVLHTTGRQILNQVFEQLHGSQQRAFTWTGPYGSGKSSLALFLASLLGSDPAARAKAIKLFGKPNLPKLHGLIPTAIGKWLVVRVVGKRQNPVEALGLACDQAVWEYWGGKPPSSLRKKFDHGDFDHVVRRLQSCAREVDAAGGGLLVIVDEMGKLLEHAAETDGDLHLFQELAEQFSRSEQLCVLIGILHQSFQEYAGRMDRRRRDEWAKIQGRFVDIAFTVSIEESIELIGGAIKGKRLGLQPNQHAKKVAGAISEGRLASSPALVDQLVRCHPLHPLAALLLPPSSRERFGQNERSIFGFLSSGEPGGFRDFLLSEPFDSDSVFTIDRLWDYLQLNLEQTILASPIGHRWAEASEALVRAGKGKEAHKRLAKAIGLLDLFGRPFSLYATDGILTAAFPGLGPKTIKSALNDLKKWSVAVYRRHLNAWAISAGSDIDIDQEVSAARAALGRDLEEILLRLPPQAPIVAKRHYHQTGTFRWFGVHILGSSQLTTKKINALRGSADGVFVLALPSGEKKGESVSGITKEIAGALDFPCLIALDPSHGKIADLATERGALSRAANRVPEVQSDPVARREIQARIDLASSQLDAEVQESLRLASWCLDGPTFTVEGEESFSRLASEISDRVYSGAPVLKNELINRHKPSSNAVAARRVLMHHMVNSHDQENLGIEKYPPELSLYLSLVRAAGLHVPSGNGKSIWCFVAPKAIGPAGHLLSLWDETQSFFERSKKEGKPVPVSDLYTAWAKPPFGLRDGVMPVLALAFVMARSDEAAIYVDGLFTPALDELVVDRLLQSPDQVAVRLVRMTGVRQEVFKRLATFSEKNLNGRKVQTALDAAKELVGFAHRLHPWVKRTKQLSKETIAIRQVLLEAHDPHALLFSDLPRACGFRKGIKGKAAVTRFITKLEVAHFELRGAYDGLIDGIKETAVRAFGLTDASEASVIALQERARRVAKSSGDMTLDALLLRFKEALSDSRWVESLASLVAKKPSRDWSDNDIIQMRVELADFAQRFDRVERYLQAHGDVKEGETVSLILSDAGGDLREYARAFELTAEEMAKLEWAISSVQEALGNTGLGHNGQAAVLSAALEQVLSNPGGKAADPFEPSLEERDVA